MEQLYIDANAVAYIKEHGAAIYLDMPQKIGMC
jgi:hypothetical protein